MMTKNLRNYTLEELETTLCDVIGCENTMDKYACQDCLQEDEPICVECCPLVSKNVKLWKMEVK